MNPLLQHGIKELENDIRDIAVGALVTLPSVITLPEAYQVPSSFIYDQGQTDTCAGHASAKISGLQEGWKLDPLFTWMIAREQANSKPEDFGIDLRSMADAHTKVGALKLTEAPFRVTDDAAKWRNITNWNVGELLKLSVYQKKKSYVWVQPSGGMDMFDTLKSTLWQFRNENVACMIGLHWPYDTSAQQDTWVGGGFGHAVALIGWTKIAGKEYLTIANSWGTGVGNNGIFYLSREIINKEVPIFGAVFFHDEDPDTLKWYIQNGVKMNDNWLYQILIAFYNVVKELRTKTAGIFNLGAAPVFPPLIEKLAHAIEQYEIVYPGVSAKYPLGSIGYRLNNPINARYHFGGYALIYGAVICDKSGFAKFKDMATGQLYARRLIQCAAMGQSGSFKSTMTITEFFNVFAPPSENDTVAYVKWICQRMGVEPTLQLKDLLITNQSCKS